jgi:cold shock CspA family protein
MRERGILRVWFDDPNKNYGFIRGDYDTGKGDLFLHRNQILEGTPKTGAQVEFEVSTSRSGRYTANAAKILN